MRGACPIDDQQDLTHQPSSDQADTGSYSAIKDCVDKLSCGDDVCAETRNLLTGLSDGVGLELVPAGSTFMLGFAL
eukprot:6208097-Pleurochrysis_carterae.AAC.1